jgi:hypothetical protein
MKCKLKEKLKSYYSKNSKCVKGICKSSPTQSKDQTRESWALKKEKRCKQKEFIIYFKKQ